MTTKTQRSVNVYLELGTVVVYKNKEKVVQGKLKFVKRPLLPFDEGITIVIGKNEYVLVKEFIDDPTKIPENLVSR